MGLDPPVVFTVMYIFPIGCFNRHNNQLKVFRGIYIHARGLETEITVDYKEPPLTLLILIVR